MTIFAQDIEQAPVAKHVCLKALPVWFEIASTNVGFLGPEAPGCPVNIPGGHIYLASPWLLSFAIFCFIAGWLGEAGPWPLALDLCSVAGGRRGRERRETSAT